MSKLILKTTDFVALLPKSDAPASDYADADFEWELVDDEDGDIIDDEDGAPASPKASAPESDEAPEGSESDEDGSDASAPTETPESDEDGEESPEKAEDAAPGAGPSDAPESDESDESETAEVEFDVDEDKGLAEGTIEEQVAEVDEGDDPFAGVASTVPTTTLETSDELVAEIEEAHSAQVQQNKANGVARPYSVHPKAAAKDVVVSYDSAKASFVNIFEHARREVSTISRSVATQLRRILWARATTRNQRDQQRGRLDRSKLHTLNRPGRKPNKRVFSRSIEGQSQDIVVGLLVDQSGSMMGTKIGCAREATIALGEALDSLSSLGIRFGVWGFDTNADPIGYAGRSTGGVGTWAVDRIESLRLHEYKAVGESWRRVATRVGAMQAGNNNVDGESIRWAAAQLREVDAARRILIVLSDGTPAAYGYGRLNEDLIAAVKELNTNGVETFGLGICDSSVRHFYPDHAVIASAKELETKLMGELQRLLLNGPKKAAA